MLTVPSDCRWRAINEQRVSGQRLAAETDSTSAGGKRMQAAERMPPSASAYWVVRTSLLFPAEALDSNGGKFGDFSGVQLGCGSLAGGGGSAGCGWGNLWVWHKQCTPKNAKLPALDDDRIASRLGEIIPSAGCGKRMVQFRACCWFASCTSSGFARGRPPDPDRGLRSSPRREKRHSTYSG